jgi:hypothetical protein
LQIPKKKGKKICNKRGEKRKREGGGGDLKADMAQIKIGSEVGSEDGRKKKKKKKKNFAQLFSFSGV